MKTHFMILAAGQGTRMRSETSKVMHKIANRTLIEHVICAARATKNFQDAANLHVVLSPKGESIQKHLEKHFDHLTFSTQQKQLGTGHAVAGAFKEMQHQISDEDLVLVLYGDTPLLQAHNLDLVLEHLRQNPSIAMTVVGMTPPDPKAYGRILQEDHGDVKSIVEFKHADEDTKRICYCNSGIMGFRATTLARYLTHLKQHSESGEYYLTDIAGLCAENNQRVSTIEIPYEDVEGVNDRKDLAACEAIFQDRMREKMMLQGVTLQDPKSVYFSADTHIEQDVLIEPHVVFGPDVYLESGATVKAFSHLEGARVCKEAVVGPYVRLRPGTHLEAKVKVGNFVEVKNTHLKEGAKASHLTYLGDAIIGRDANIGAGTITCNYDGFQKHQTIVEDGAFIGSNTCLVAPVHIGKSALIAAGSTITKAVSDGALALSRTLQKELEYKSPFVLKQNVKKHSQKVS